MQRSFRALNKMRRCAKLPECNSILYRQKERRETARGIIYARNEV